MQMQKFNLAIETKAKFKKHEFEFQISIKTKNPLFFSTHGLLKRHSIFLLKLNRILDFFRFNFSLSSRKTSFKSQFQFSIKIEIE